MGEQTIRGNEQSVPIIEPVKGNGSNRSGSKGTSTAGSGTGGRGTGGSGAGGSEGRAEEVKTPESNGLSLLNEKERKAYETADEKERKRLLTNAKARERYKQDKAQGKPKKVTKKAKAPEPDVKNFNLMIAGLSSAIASRPNCEHWLLTEQEINSITVPLANMIKESEKFANLGEYSNQIALATACLTIFTPRLIITAQKNKEAKKVAKTGQHTNTNPEPERTSGEKKNGNPKLNTGNVSKPSSNGSTNDKAVPYYGSPIA